MYHLRALFDLALKRVSNDTVLGTFLGFLDELIVDTFVHVRAGSSATTLALVEEKGEMSHLYSVVNIGILADNERGFSSEF